MASIIELPSLIKVDMEEPSFRKAVQQNFDHLAMALKVSLGAAEEAHQEAAVVKDEVNRINPAEGSDALNAQLAAAGVGAEDGSPPPQVTNVRAVGGIANWFQVIFDGVTNSSPVTYDVHVSTTNGFSHAANTYVGSFTIPGGSTKSGMLTVRSFPSTHVLFGTTILPTTTYYVKVVAKDGSGEGPPSAQVTVSPILASAAQMIAANTIIGDDLIIQNTISGDKIVGRSITGEKISGGTIDAITITSASLASASINGGSITGVTITGGTVRTAAGGNRVELSGARASEVVFFLAGSEVASIQAAIVGGDRLFFNVGGGTSFSGAVTCGALSCGTLTAGGAINTQGNNITNIASDALRFSTRLLSATAGAQGAPPGQVAGYVRVQVEGINYKIPFYNI